MTSTGENQLKSKLRDIDSYDFEKLVADLWEEHGWNTEVTQQSKDKGVDVVAERDYPYTEKEIIQTKRYAGNQSIVFSDMQQYATLTDQEEADIVVVVTTGKFTKEARDLASQLGVKIVDVDDLCEFIRHHDHYDVVRDYSYLPTDVEREKRRLNEPVTFNGTEATVPEYDTASELSSLEESITPSSGNTFLLVRVQVKNAGKRKIEFPSPLARYEKGKISSISHFSLLTFKANDESYIRYKGIRTRLGFSLGENPYILPGFSVDGWLVFEVPQDFVAMSVLIEIDLEGRYEKTKTFCWRLTHSI